MTLPPPLRRGLTVFCRILAVLLVIAAPETSPATSTSTAAVGAAVLVIVVVEDHLVRTSNAILFHLLYHFFHGLESSVDILAPVHDALLYVCKSLLDIRHIDGVGGDLAVLIQYWFEAASG